MHEIRKQAFGLLQTTASRWAVEYSRVRFPSLLGQSQPPSQVLKLPLIPASLLSVSPFTYLHIDVQYGRTSAVMLQ
jgi:hypothetical protein